MTDQYGRHSSLQWVPPNNRINPTQRCAPQPTCGKNWRDIGLEVGFSTTDAPGGLCGALGAQTQ